MINVVIRRPWLESERKHTKTMKNKNKSQDHHLTDADLDYIVPDFGFTAFPRRTNAEWIKALESRLEQQRREFASLLDHAGEKPSLLKYCREIRREMDDTKRRLADCYYLNGCLN